MIKKVLNKLESINRKLKIKENQNKRKTILQKFFENGKIPWSSGYEYYKEDTIIEYINDEEILKGFRKNKLPINFGYRIDERVIEYPWIFSKMEKGNKKVLDAGSTFNFEYLLDHKYMSKKEKYIYTFYPESKSYNDKKVSYVYGDLRELPFKSDFFEEIVCQSTIEHIDMDNSMYGYDLESTIDMGYNKSYEYLRVVEELIRVLKPKGQLLLTFPYGKFENHGFFQQFDKEMVDRIIKLFKGCGSYEINFFKYQFNGWSYAKQEELVETVSHNPHTGKGVGEDQAAHSRAIACIEFNKD